MSIPTDVKELIDKLALSYLQKGAPGCELDDMKQQGYLGWVEYSHISQTNQCNTSTPWQVSFIKSKMEEYLEESLEYTRAKKALYKASA